MTDWKFALTAVGGLAVYAAALYILALIPTLPRLWRRAKTFVELLLLVVRVKWFHITHPNWRLHRVARTYWSVR